MTTRARQQREDRDRQRDESLTSGQSPLASSWLLHPGLGAFWDAVGFVTEMMKPKSLLIYSIGLGFILMPGALMAASSIQFKTPTFETTELDGFAEHSRKKQVAFTSI
jgi:hypothetical protein